MVLLLRQRIIRAIICCFQSLLSYMSFTSKQDYSFFNTSNSFTGDKVAAPDSLNKSITLQIKSENTCKPDVT